MAAAERVLTPLAPTSNAGLSAPRRAAILIAVLLGAMFAALDQLVVITAMPRVVADLGGLGQFAWVFTAYMLTSTVTLPIYGKLSDMYGRRPFWIAGLALFMLGSALAGASQAMIHLVLARAVQGLGAGALMALGAAIFGDLFPPSERGKWQGLLAAVFGLVFIAGPTLGGWITDNLSWRWIFYVNLPLGGIALAAAWIALPGAGRRTSHALDLRGALALVGAAVPLLLALGWAGTEFPWVSAEIIGLLAVGLVGLFALIAVERRAPEPIVNLGFLTQPRLCRVDHRDDARQLRAAWRPDLHPAVRAGGRGRQRHRLRRGSGADDARLRDQRADRGPDHVADGALQGARGGSVRHRHRRGAAARSHGRRDH